MNLCLQTTETYDLWQSKSTKGRVKKTNRKFVMAFVIKREHAAGGRVKALSNSFPSLLHIKGDFDCKHCILSCLRYIGIALALAAFFIFGSFGLNVLGKRARCCPKILILYKVHVDMTRAA